MASPQKEDGYTAIANEIMENLAKLYLSSQEWRVLIAILRKTYGYHKKEDQISLSQLSEITGMDRRHIHRAISKLSPKQVIAVTHTGDSQTLTYRFQKDYTKWCHPYRNTSTVTHTGDKTVTHTGTHKRKKDNIKDSRFKFKKSVHIPANIFLTENMKNYVKKQGANGNYAEELFEAFKNWHGAKGTKYQDWTKTFFNWVLKDKRDIHPDKYKIMVRVAD